MPAPGLPVSVYGSLAPTDNKAGALIAGRPAEYDAGAGSKRPGLDSNQRPAATKATALSS